MSMGQRKKYSFPLKQQAGPLISELQETPGRRSFELISSLKSTYYTSLINEHSSDQRVLFRTVNKLMQKSHETRYPPSLSNALLADSFADFFTAKVEKIHTALVARNRDLSLADDNELFTNAAELNNFHEVSQEDVKQLAYKPLQ